MNTKQTIVNIVLILAALTFLVVFIGGLILEAARASDNATKFKVACVQSGQSWAYDNNGHEVCK